MAKTDPTKGTNFRDTEALLKLAQTKLRFNYRNLFKQQDFIHEKSYKAMIRRYNKAAKSKKQPIIKNVNMPKKNFPDLKYFIYKEIRAKDKSLKANFISKWIEPNINKGIPIGWSVIIFPDNDKGQIKGHMRIINGYNKKTNQIIYTDSWGAGHEKKSMSLERACNETLSLFVITTR